MTQITTPLGITLEYETHGNPADPPVLLVMGFGVQLVEWPRDFSQELADGGRYVVTFDNRDAGLSQWLDDVSANLEQIMVAGAAEDVERMRELAPYTFSDMADDGLGLLTALGIKRAHVVGASMGGMVAQTMAIEHPERLLSLTSLMSNTGESEYGQSTLDVLEALTTPSPTDREAYIDASERSMLWHSKRYPERELVREIAAESFDRGNNPAGEERQTAAMFASGSRADGLRQLKVPTLVIHGLQDTLIAPSGGERTADLVPDAKLVLIEDMSHDRPRPLWPQIIGAILEHTGAVEPTAVA